MLRCVHLMLTVSKRARAVHSTTLPVLCLMLCSIEHTTLPVHQTMHTRQTLLGKQLQQSAPSWQAAQFPLIQYRYSVGCCFGTRVIWQQYAVYNCSKDGTYPLKVKFQLLQTLMFSQLSFKLFQLKAILCCSTLQNTRWLVSDPHNLCSLHNACKAAGKVETYPLSTKAADETHTHKWMQLDGNGEHESVGTNMVICSPRKCTKCEKFVGYTNAHTTWVDGETVWETLYMEHAAFSHNHTRM